jgi:uncharacterized damage-inducible protein DinB
MIAEFTQEAATTRRVLERVPDGNFSWAPHTKSMTLGQLALHIAGIPNAITNLFAEATREFPTVPLAEATSREQILSTFDEGVNLARQRIEAWGDEGLNAQCTLTKDGKPLFSMPRKVMLRTILLNHWYHHRGQLTVYLRLLDVPVPYVYGRSADESPFG